jgi:hypothetical protein
MDTADIARENTFLKARLAEVEATLAESQEANRRLEEILPPPQLALPLSPRGQTKLPIWPVDHGYPAQVLSSSPPTVMRRINHQGRFWSIIGAAGI